MDLRTSLLSYVSTPDKAYLTLLIGLLLVYREFTRPGLVLPGVAGGVAVVTALFALGEYKVQAIGVGLSFIALILLIVQAVVRAYWAPGVAGALLLMAGARLLVQPPWRISLWVALLSLPFSGITVFLLRTAVRARRNKVSITGRS